jgi:hypothetical protein
MPKRPYEVQPRSIQLSMRLCPFKFSSLFIGLHCLRKLPIILDRHSFHPFIKVLHTFCRCSKAPRYKEALYAQDSIFAYFCIHHENMMDQSHLFPFTFIKNLLVSLISFKATILLTQEASDHIYLLSLTIFHSRR